jgi:hypothetical protein
MIVTFGIKEAPHLATLKGTVFLQGRVKIGYKITWLVVIHKSPRHMEMVSSV